MTNLGQKQLILKKTCNTYFSTQMYVWLDISMRSNSTLRTTHFMACYFCFMALTVAIRTGRVELNKPWNLLMISVETDSIILPLKKNHLSGIERRLQGIFQVQYFQIPACNLVYQEPYVFAALPVKGMWKAIGWNSSPCVKDEVMGKGSEMWIEKCAIH